MKHIYNTKIKYFSFMEFIYIFLVLMSLSALPALMYGRSFKDTIHNEYTIWYILYWFLVTVIICIFTSFHKYKTFSHPLRKLSNAAKAVSQGDFSVYIEPSHPDDKKDYMDIIFEDFNQMVRELGSIETLKNDFISNVSHEIRTPLAVIQNYSTILKSDTLSDQEKREYLDIIIEATHKLTNLITNILKLNKLENQEIPALIEPYDLCRQLCDCIFNFEQLLETKNIELEIEIEDQVIINADEELLELVWNNLLSNAIKFTDSNGKISIKQRSHQYDVIIEISDTGCGIHQDSIKYIFDKFYQADTSHSKEGNGLGLALVHRIIEKMNGSISVSSYLDVGTSFIITLPHKNLTH